MELVDFAPFTRSSLHHPELPWLARIDNSPMTHVSFFLGLICSMSHGSDADTRVRSSPANTRKPFGGQLVIHLLLALDEEYLERLLMVFWFRLKFKLNPSLLSPPPPLLPSITGAGISPRTPPLLSSCPVVHTEADFIKFCFSVFVHLL